MRLNVRHLMSLVILVLAATVASADNFTLVSAGGNWSNTSVWLQNAVPATRYPGQLVGTPDNVSLTALSYTVTVDVTIAEAVTLNTTCPSNTSTCVTDVPAGGTLRLTGGSSIGSDARLKLTGGTITNNGTLNLNANSNFDWTAGTLNGSGQVSAVPASNINTTGSSMILTGGEDIVLSGTLTYGSTASGFVINSGSTITILSGGVMDIKNSSGIGTDGAGSPNITINSGGTFKKTGGAFGTNILPTVHNAGLVQTTINTLVLTSGVNSGTFDMNGAGTGIGFAGNPTLNNGTIIQGAGTAFFGSLVTINGLVTATNVSMDSFGGILGSGTLEVSGGFAWRGGTISAATVKLLLGSAATVTGESNATLTNNGNLIVNGTFDVNPGVGTLSLTNGGVITNNGTINLAGDVSIGSNVTGNPRIDNSSGALIVKNAGAGNATLTVGLNNSGDVKSTSGNIVFNRGGVHTDGVFHVCDGCYFDFAGGTHTLDNTTLTFWNTGTGSALKLAGATFNVINPDGAYVGIDFFQFSGTVTGDGIFNVDSNFTWSGGTHSGTGTTDMNPGHTHKLDGASGAMVLNGRYIANHGILNYSPSPNSLSITGGGTIKNFAGLNLTNDGPITGDGTGSILNEGGTVTKNGGSGLSQINAIFDSYNPVIIIGFSRGVREQGLVPVGASLTVNSGQVGLNAGGTNSANIILPNATNAVVFGGSNYTLASGTTTFPADLGVFRVNGGTLTLGTALSLTNVELLSGTITGSDLTVTNKMKWTGGTLLGPGTTTIAATATLVHLAPTAPTSLNNRTLDVNGSADYEGSGLQLLNNATINNNAGATFNVRDGFILNGAGGNFFNNAGTLKKIGTSTGMRFDVPVVNSGTVSSEVNGQSLIFAGGGSQSAGSLTTTGSALIDFFGGTFTVSGGALSGTGQHRVNGGTLKITVNLGPPAITLALMSGTLEITSPNTFQVNSLAFTGGTVQGPGTLRVFGGSIGNTSPTNLAGGATLTIASGPFTYFADNASFLTINDTAKLNVESGSLFEILGDNVINGAATAAVTSSGTFRKTFGGLTNIKVPFTSSLGSVGATNGMLRFSAGGTISTTIETGVFAEVSFATGTYAINSGASVTGTGAILIEGATFNVNIAFSVPKLQFSFGTIGGSGSLTATTWVQITTAVPSTLNIPLTNAGTMTIEGDLGGSGSILNNGTFNRLIVVAIPPTVAPAFTNAGTANFNAGSIGFTGGYTQTAGSTNLLGGTFTSPLTVQLNGGVLQGNGTVGASVANNNGTVAPGLSPGLIIINGNYTQAPNGILNIQLGGTSPGTQYDQLAVTGSATLAGTVNVTLINAFTLSNGDVFNAVTYAAHSGIFAPENLPPFPGGTFTSTYTPAAYQLAAAVASPADVSVTKTGPATAQSGDFVSYTIVVKNLGTATSASVILNDPTPAGLTFKANTGDCTVAFPCTLGALPAGATRTVVATYKVGITAGAITNTASIAVTDANNANNTASAVTTVSCPNVAPSNLSPTGTAGVSGTLSWAAAGAELYEVFLGPKGGGCTTSFGKTTISTFNYSGLQPNTEYEWRVESSFDGCPIQSSACVAFKTDACNALEAPIASVIGEATSAKSYAVLWEVVPFATRYEVDEATDAGFGDAVTTVVNNGLSLTFNHESAQPKGYYYRVRPFGNCNDAPGPYSEIIRVVIVPPSLPTAKNPVFNVPVGSTDLLVHKIFIPGDPAQTLFYTAKSDREWLFVTPPAGALPPQGVTLDAIIDPHELPNGTFTATIIVTIDGATSGRLATHGTTVSTPISVNLVTPVTPVPVKSGPSQFSLIVPAVGHINGIDSAWQSDVRITNVGFRAYKYRLNFTPAKGSAAGVKQTDVTVDAGGTMALDDIVKNWYGFGSLGDGESGTLEIVPLDDPANASLVTVAASRTYNVTQAGTLGQFVPAVPFPRFVGKAASGGLATILSLQQLAQNNAFRTNVGVVEAQGKSANAVVSIFNATGVKLIDLPQTLLAGQQLQLNALLAQNNITLADGRVEVRVTGGDGKVTAYASVVDNATGDPLLVSGVPLTQAGSTKFVLPGAANINTGFADWRTDMRVFNYGTVPQTATLTFYPLGNGTPRSAEVLAKVGEVLALDNVVKTLFGGDNTGGAVHVTTSQPASFIVSGRTYNQTSNGTLGQFINAVSVEQGIARGGRSLQILQIEDSVRYRANIGVTELSGKPATVEISVILPDSKITPIVEVPLAANEFRQLNVIRELNLGNVYNARVSVKVIGGDGRVTAFASLIDEFTGDPAFIQGQ
jgi:uncharacterized repeat protein (TIGR01451 family)